MRHTASAGSGAQLRVALLTGHLGWAGAEKQTFYMARCLARTGISVRVYTLTRGGVYEGALRALSIEPRWFGRFSHPLLRLPHLIAMLQAFQPHIIQSIHAYTNPYSGLAGRALRVLSIGGLRGDLSACLKEHGKLAGFVLRAPHALAVNSRRALEEIMSREIVRPERAYFLPNGIDLAAFGDGESETRVTPNAPCTCIYVGRLIRSKRVDMFLRAVAAARRSEPSVKGLVVGDGPEAGRLHQLSEELGLWPDHVSLLGFRENVSALLRGASVFVFCSNSEGAPNVLLEAMAARLPIVTTPAGDAASMVEQAGAGYIVPCGDSGPVARAIVTLARSRELRGRLGSAGRTYVEQHHATSRLADRLLAIYADAARVCSRHASAERLRRMLPTT